MTVTTSHSQDIDVLLQQKKTRQHNDSNMIPMINIVFLLLIFFMIAGQIKPITQAGIEIPVATIEKEAQLQPLRLEMDKHNQLTLNGQAIDLAILQQQLASHHSMKTKVTLIADRRVLAVNLNHVLELFRRQGQSDITLFTQPTGNQP